MLLRIRRGRREQFALLKEVYDDVHRHVCVPDVEAPPTTMHLPNSQRQRETCVIVFECVNFEYLFYKNDTCARVHDSHLG